MSPASSGGDASQQTAGRNAGCGGAYGDVDIFKGLNRQREISETFREENS